MKCNIAFEITFFIIPFALNNVHCCCELFYYCWYESLLLKIIAFCCPSMCCGIALFVRCHQTRHLKTWVTLFLSVLSLFFAFLTSLFHMKLICDRILVDCQYTHFLRKREKFLTCNTNLFDICSTKSRISLISHLHHTYKIISLLTFGVTNSRVYLWWIYHLWLQKVLYMRFIMRFALCDHQL